MNFRNEKELKIFFMGPLQMILSSACFAFMSYFAKLATEDIPSNEVTFFRLAVGVLVTLALVYRGGVKLRTENLNMLIVRGFFGGVAVLLFFIALEKGSITNSVVLQNTYPIFASLISLYVLKERLNFKLVLFMIITFSGIVILVRPDIGSIRAGDIFALVSGLLGGFAVTAVRQLRMKNESVWTIFFYFCLFGAVISLILAIPSWIWPQPKEYMPLFLTGLLGLLGQVTMTSAYKYCSTAVGGVLSMSTGVFSYIIGVSLLKEHVGMIDLTGVFLIIAGNALVVTFESMKDKREGDPESILDNY